MHILFNKKDFFASLAEVIIGRMLGWLFFFLNTNVKISFCLKMPSNSIVFCLGFFFLIFFLSFSFLINTTSLIQDQMILLF